MLISQMLQVNVEARFTADEVLSHPWVTVSDWRIGSSKSLIKLLHWWWWWIPSGRSSSRRLNHCEQRRRAGHWRRPGSGWGLSHTGDQAGSFTCGLIPVVTSAVRSWRHHSFRNLFRFFFLLRSFFFSFFLFIQENLFSLIQNTGFSHCRSNRFVWLVYRNTPHSVETEKKHIQVNVHQSLQWLKLKTTRSLRGNSLTNWTLNSHSEQSRSHRPAMVLTSRSKMDLGSKTYYTLNTVKTVQSSAFLKR